MQIELPDDLNLTERASLAGYSRVEEYLIDLIRQDEEIVHDVIVDTKANRILDEDELRQELRKGLDSLDAGRSIPLDIEDIRRRGRLRNQRAS